MRFFEREREPKAQKHDRSTLKSCQTGFGGLGPGAVKML
ncbi:MAG: hypothetical protein ACI89J_004634, partial [Hyphomicrobiaceae bacterium]